MKKHIKQSSILIVLAVSVWLGVGMSLVQATNYDAQIRLLKDRSKTQRAKQQALEVEANSIEEIIKVLRHRMKKLKEQIAANDAKSKQLEATIAAQKIELAKQKKILGSNVRQMYLDSDTSTLEKLASSNNLSEYVDKQQYRVSVQDKIQTTLERIKKLQKELKAQKIEVDQLLQDQIGMRAAFAADREQKDSLLRLNKHQQSKYNKDIAKNNAHIAVLRQQQAIENGRGFSSVSYVGSGSYPWANVPFPNSMSDPWGMYKRQCVSYAAWKVASTGRRMPYWGGRGNANQWDDNARAAGIPVSSTPRKGSVAVSNAGYYGHVMYVEDVHDDGTISISQYNGDWSGRYSTGRRSTAGLVFIYF